MRIFYVCHLKAPALEWSFLGNASDCCQCFEADCCHIYCNFTRFLRTSVLRAACIQGMYLSEVMLTLG